MNTDDTNSKAESAPASDETGPLVTHMTLVTEPGEPGAAVVQIKIEPDTIWRALSSPEEFARFHVSLLPGMFLASCNAVAIPHNLASAMLAALEGALGVSVRDGLEVRREGDDAGRTAREVSRELN